MSTPPAPPPARPPAPPRAPAPLRRREMVRWFDPPQLVRTALHVATSTLFGRYSDHRLIEALATPANTPGIYDYRTDEGGRPREELWLDYVSDTGDGWSSTYAVAHTLARPVLALPGAGDTERGCVLVFGGDEVYPAPSRSEYEARLVQPYAAARAAAGAPPPDVFAIPGNHDWYDGLVAFTRLFCSGRRFAGCPTRQSRSYFALRLPHGWWLLGTDVQLGSDIDAPQVEYFKRVAAEMAPDDRVILCNAEPSWVYAKVYGRLDAESVPLDVEANKLDVDINETNLTFLERRVLGKRVSVCLAGDLHHYRRHESPDGRQKITCGGGGAFLHPTHGADVERLTGDFTLRASYPPPDASRRLCFRNLAFLPRNWRFAVVPGVLYALTSCSVNVDLSRLSPLSLGDWYPAATAALRETLTNPVAGFWLVSLVLGIWLFTDTHVRWYRFVMGTLHGLWHLGAAFVIAWGASALIAPRFAFGSIPHSVLGSLVVFAIGGAAGSVIMGVYLLVSLNVFGRHANEAFSAIRVEDWKSFLRLRIDRSGALTVYPVGIRRVPRLLRPYRGSEATVPELIEPPVTVSRPAAAS